MQGDFKLTYDYKLLAMCSESHYTTRWARNQKPLSYAIDRYPDQADYTGQAELRVVFTNGVTLAGRLEFLKAGELLCAIQRGAVL